VLGAVGIVAVFFPLSVRAYRWRSG